MSAYVTAILQGAVLTVGVSLASLLVAIVLGLLGASAKLSGRRGWVALGTAYTTVIRGIPDLVLMLLIFYGGTIGLNNLLEWMGSEATVDINPFVAGVLTLGFIYGAYMTETFRGAILAIPHGQIEAAWAFGMGRTQTFLRITAPQMVRYFARYPGVARYMEETRQQARDKGYVETVFGRRLWLPEIKSSNVGRRQGAERAAINAPMQGTAADLIKLAMIAVQGWLDEHDPATRLILQVHDELVLEVPTDELAVVREALPRLMGNVAKLAVPLLVEVGAGANWEEAH